MTTFSGQEEVKFVRPINDVDVELSYFDPVFVPVTRDGVYVFGEFIDQNLQLLVDTGASYTILSSRVYKQIPSDVRPELEPLQMRCKSMC